MIHKKFYFWLLLLQFVVLNTHFCFSQPEREEGLGTWVVISGNHTIAEQWSIPTIVILRNYEFFDHYEFSFYRTGITYTTNKGVNFTVGAAYLDLKGFKEAKELRANTQFWIYQQLAFKSKLSFITMANRFRLENRWINRLNSNDFNLRLRHRLQFTIPIYESKLYTKVFNELFFDLNESKLFDQNRIFMGLGTTLIKNVKLEAGYLKNHFNPKHYDRFRIALIFKTDLRKRAGKQK